MNPNFNNQNYNNYNQNYNNYNSNQGNYNQNPNYNNMNQRQGIPNNKWPNKNQNNNQNNQNNQNKGVINQHQEKLRIAYNIFTAGVKDYKNYSLELALDKFEKVSKIIKEAYPYIQNDPKLKETTIKFQRQVNQYLTQTDYQIKHKYDFKSTAGYADTDYKKKQENEIAQMIKDAENQIKEIIIIFHKIIIIIKIIIIKIIIEIKIII